MEKNEMITTGKGYSPAQTQVVRSETIRQIVGSKRELLEKSSVRVSLQDTDAVRQAADRYLSHCTEYAVLPSFVGLAATLGISRMYLYRFLDQHRDSDTGRLLEQLRSLFTDARITAADRNAAPESLTIFLLKNGNEGFSDKHEVDMAQHNPTNDPFRPEWAWGMSTEEYHKRLREHLEEVYLTESENNGDIE